MKSIKNNNGSNITDFSEFYISVEFNTFTRRSLEIRLLQLRQPEPQDLSPNHLDLKHWPEDPWT